MDNSLLAVRDINHKYIVVEGSNKTTIIPEGVKSIGEDAFYGRTGLTNITIPSSVTKIEGNVFVGCSNLKYIQIDKNNTIYDSRNECNAIIQKEDNRLIVGCNNTIIPETVEIIGNSAFQGCSEITSIALPTNLKRIEEGAFYKCSSLINIELPDTVISIGEGAFLCCTNLKSVAISSKLCEIGDRAFNACENLEKINVDKNNPVFDSRNNCNAIIKKENDSLIVGCNNTKIPDDVTIIGDCAFNGCTGITSIVIPSSVKEIQGFAFNDCTGLSSIVLSEGLTSIGKYSFNGCTGITSIVIPSSVKEIKYCAFNRCTNLTSITWKNVEYTDFSDFRDAFKEAGNTCW